MGRSQLRWGKNYPWQCFLLCMTATWNSECLDDRAKPRQWIWWWTHFRRRDAIFHGVMDTQFHSDMSYALIRPMSDALLQRGSYLALTPDFWVLENVVLSSELKRKWIRHALNRTDLERKQNADNEDSTNLKVLHMPTADKNDWIFSGINQRWRTIGSIYC